jgi:hypothetical protein
MPVTGKMLEELAKKISEAERRLETEVSACERYQGQSPVEIKALLEKVAAAQKEKNAAYQGAIIAVMKEKGGSLTGGELFDLMCDLVDAMGWSDPNTMLTRAIVGEEHCQDKSISLLWAFLAEVEGLVIRGVVRHEKDIFILDEKKGK